MWITADGSINSVAFDPNETPGGAQLIRFIGRLPGSVRAELNGRIYEWFTTLVPDPDLDSLDLAEEAKFARVDLPDRILEEVARGIIDAGGEPSRVEKIFEKVDDRWRPDAIEFVQSCLDFDD